MSNKRIETINYNNNNNGDDNYQQQKMWECFNNPNILKYIISFLSNDGEKFSLNQTTFGFLTSNKLLIQTLQAENILETISVKKGNYEQQVLQLLPRYFVKNQTFECKMGKCPFRSFACKE